jgi:hypothetical protein
VPTIDPDQLLEQAVADTGLSDFGADGFREGLETYCASAANEAQLNALGEMAVPAFVTENLRRRLRIIDYAKTHPQVRDETIERPLIVVGLHRAGTTLLSNLLDLDPASRSLLHWEAADSVPPPTPDTWRSGERVAASQAVLAASAQTNPELLKAHNEQADGPTECITVTAQDFKSLMWETMANVPTYGEWLLKADYTSTYAHHKLILQILQSGGVRGTWSLKAPGHAVALEELSAAYPDSTFVVMHRDPVVVAASSCSLIRTLSKPFTDADQRPYLARHWTDILEACISGIESFRTNHPEHRMVHVPYQLLMTDPMAAMRQIYAGAGRDLDPAAEAAMLAYLEAHPKGQFGKHAYALDELGLDGAALADRFSAYIERHQIAREAL